jgi:glutamyl endopeptidase
VKKIRNSITSAAGAALLAAALLATSSPALQAAADDDPAPNPAEVSPVGIDSSGQSLTWQPDDAPASSGDSVPGYKPDSIESAPSSIIGEDERVRLTDTTAYPNSAIVYISKGGKPYCTGWMISADTLVTAGHCVYSYERQEWTSGLEFSPGANGPERPFETATATQKWTDVAWVKNNDPRLDWGLVKLDKPLGDRTGWFGLTWRSEDYKDIGVELRGYPYDKAPGELWGMGGTVTESRGNQLCYLMDTFPAQSGSPLYMSDGAFAIGIHAYGTVRGQQQPGRECPQEYNAGTRITKGLYELFVDLKSRR